MRSVPSRKGPSPGETPLAKTRVRVGRLMLPTDVNFAGNVFGGSILRVVDEVAYASASRLARSNVVTASLDRMDFLAPVHLGEMVTFEGIVTFVGRSSLEVCIDIQAEDLLGGTLRPVGSCYVTMVALDRDGKPMTVPRVVPQTPEEKARWSRGSQRQRARRTSRARQPS